MNTLLIIASLIFAQSTFAFSTDVPGATPFEKVKYLYDNGTLLDLDAVSDFAYSGRCFSLATQNKPIASYFLVAKVDDNLGPISSPTFTYYIGSQYYDGKPADHYDKMSFKDFDQRLLAKQVDSTTYSITYAGKAMAQFRQGGAYIVGAQLDSGSNIEHFCYYYNRLN